VARTMAVSAATRPARTRWRPVVLAFGLWALVLLGLVVTAWLNHLLRRAGRPDLAGRGADPVPTALAALSAATVGAVVASHRPSHPVGWLLLGLGLSVPWSDVLDGYVDQGVLARPGSLPAARYLAVYSPAVFMAGLACAGFVLLLTPSGSLASPSRRWRWRARALGAAPVVFLLTVALLPEPLDPTYASVANPLGLPGGLPVEVPLLAVNVLAGAVVLLTVPVACVSLVVRFRHARGLERQQLRWLASAAGLASVGAALVLAGTSLPTSPSLTLALITWGAGVCLVLLPLAIGAAILRYRLYDLDRIISRTLVYGLLTLLLGGGYAAVVLGLGQLLGQDSSLVVAAATLAVAAVFQPARRRIQQAVDRRFNRRRHDTARTIAAFSGRLREQVDLDTLTGELLAVVDQTMQPASASLWLRPPPDHARPLPAIDR
jgi:MFS family permease